MPEWRRQAPEGELLPALRHWFRSPLGQALLSDELAMLNAAVEQCRGLRFLELSIAPEFCTVQANQFRRRYCLGTPAQQSLGQQLDVQCRFPELPIASESQDVVVLHHLLEFMANPHEVLREVERVLVPHGTAIVISFNPYSLLALGMLVSRLRSGSVWRNHFLTSRRVSDWLQLLGFEVDDVSYGFHRLPLNSPRWLMRHRMPPRHVLRRIPLGGVQLLSAIKYRAPLTPAKMRWSAEPLANVRPLGAARGGAMARRRALR